jgi:hypothetical protein
MREDKRVRYQDSVAVVYNARGTCGGSVQCVWR